MNYIYAVLRAMQARNDPDDPRRSYMKAAVAERLGQLPRREVALRFDAPPAVPEPTPEPAAVTAPAPVAVGEARPVRTIDPASHEAAPLL